MKALLVGLGSIGRRHLANLRHLRPDASITVLRHARGSEATEEASLADRVVYQLAEALEGRPDCAIISSPSPFHLQTAVELADQGVHLCIEKPLSDRLEGVDDLLRKCRQRELVLLVGYNLRFYRPLVEMRAAIREGRIGRVLGLRAEVGQYLPDWRPSVDYRLSVSARDDRGGGVLLELSHELDYARWLMGEVVSVWSHAAKVSDLEIDVEDFAEVTLCFREGAVGHIHLDMVQRSPTRQCRVIGTDGTLTWNGQEHRVAWYCGRTKSWRDIHAAGPVDRNQMYLDELRHFLDCIEGKAEPCVSGEDGKRALQIALAARQSSRLRKAIDL